MASDYTITMELHLTFKVYVYVPSNETYLITPKAKGLSSATVM